MDRWCFHPEDAALVAMWIGPHRKEYQEIQNDKENLQFNAEQTGNDQARLPECLAAAKGMVATVWQLMQKSSGPAEEAEKTNAKEEEKTTKQTDTVFQECLPNETAANPAADPAAATVEKEAAHLKDTAAPPAADVEATEEAIPAHSGVTSVPAASAPPIGVAREGGVHSGWGPAGNRTDTVPRGWWNNVNGEALQGPARPCEAWQWQGPEQGPQQGPEQGTAMPPWIDRGPSKASGYKIWIGDLPPKLNQVQFMNQWLNVDPVIAEALRTGNLTDVHIYSPAGNVSGEQVAYLTFDKRGPAMACMQVISTWGRYSDRGGGKVWVKLSVRWVS